MYHVELRQFPHNMCRFNLTDRELQAIAVPWSRGDWVEVGDRKWSPHQATLTILESERIPVNQLSIGRGWRNAKRQSEDVTARLLSDASKSGGPAGAGGWLSWESGSPAGEGAPKPAVDNDPADDGFDGGVDVSKAGADVSRASADVHSPDAFPSAREDEPHVDPGHGLVLDPGLVLDSLGPDLVRMLGVDDAKLSRAWRRALEESPGRSPSVCLALAEEALRSAKPR